MVRYLSIALFFLCAATSAVAECLSVYDITNLALGRSPSIALAQAEEGAAKARLAAARAQGLPQINVFGQTGLGEGQPLDQARDDQIGVSANWELFTFGERAAANAAARESYQASRFSTLGTSADIAERALLLALELERAQRIFSLVSAQVDAYSREAETAETRLNRGFITLSDARQIDARFAASVARREEAAAERDVVAVELAVVIDQPVSCIDEMSTEQLSQDLALGLADTTPEAAFAQAEVYAAPLRQAEAELRAAEARLREARRAGAPSLSFNAFVLGEYNDSTLPADDRWSRDDRVGFSVRQEIFGGGSLRARRSEARQQTRGAEASLEAARQELEIAVRRAFLSALRQDAVFQRRAAAERAARERFEAAQLELSRATKTITDFVLGGVDGFNE